MNLQDLKRKYSGQPIPQWELDALKAADKPAEPAKPAKKAKVEEVKTDGDSN